MKPEAARPEARPRPRPGTPAQPEGPAQPEAPTQPEAPAQPDEYIQLPGVFRRWEIEPVLGAGSNFRAQEVDRAADGAPLFAVWVRAYDAAPSRPQGLVERLGKSPLVARCCDESVFEPAKSTRDHAQLDSASRRELKALRREEHICFACSHHLVCRNSSRFNETLLVTISRCGAFTPAERGGDGPTCELLPIEPITTP